jgi:hypothetical protein
LYAPVDSVQTGCMGASSSQIGCASRTTSPAAPRESCCARQRRTIVVWHRLGWLEDVPGAALDALEGLLLRTEVAEQRQASGPSQEGMVGAWVSVQMPAPQQDLPAPGQRGSISSQKPDTSYGRVQGPLWPSFVAELPEQLQAAEGTCAIGSDIPLELDAPHEEPPAWRSIPPALAAQIAVITDSEA